MNRKGVIIGTIIGCLLGISIATYANTIYNYTIQGTIIVPSETIIQLTGIPRDYEGNLVFPELILNNAIAKARFDMRNMGSSGVVITYTATSSDPKLNVTLEGYIGGSSFGNQFVPGHTVILDRAEHIDCNLIVEDLGAEPGPATFTLIITIS